MSISISTKEHDYIHSSQPTMEQITSQTYNQDLNMKATELRLGLPGSESPQRTINAVKNLVSGAKRGFSDTWGLSKNGGFIGENKNSNNVKGDHVASSLSSTKHLLDDNHSQDSHVALKTQVVGWPPIRSFRKNSMAVKNTKNEDDPNAEIGSCVYVKVSMDGAPYLRKVDLKIYSSYLDLSLALQKMFSNFTLGQCGTHGITEREGSNESPLMNFLNGSEYVLTYEDKDGDLMLVGDVPWDMFTGSCKRMRIMKSSDAIGLAPRAVEECKSHN